MQQEENFEQIVETVKGGNTASFQLLYDRTVRMVYRTVCFLMENRRDVDDIVQEIYLEVFKNIHKYNAQRPFRSWLYGYVLKQVSSSRRKSWRLFRIQNKVSGQAHESSPDFAEETVERLNNHDLISQIEHLPFKYKQILVFHYLHEFSLSEIALTLDIPAGTVKSRLNAALAKLRNNRKVTNFRYGGKVENSQ